MEFSSSKNQHKIIRWASQCALWVVNRGSREEKPLGLVSYIWEYPIPTPKMGIWALFGMECIENRSAAKKLSEKSLTAQFQELNAPRMVFSFSLAAEQIWLTFGVRLLPSRSRCTGWNSNTNTWKDQEYKEADDWLKQDSKSVTIMEGCEAKGKKEKIPTLQKDKQQPRPSQQRHTCSPLPLSPERFLLRDLFQKVILTLSTMRWWLQIRVKPVRYSRGIVLW